MRTGITVTIDRWQLLRFTAYTVGMIALTGIALGIVLGRKAFNFVRLQAGLTPIVWQAVSDGYSAALG